MSPVGHRGVAANGIRPHVARTGAGCPEFWLAGEPVMLRLAGRFALIAPDLRGFGRATGRTPTCPPAGAHSIKSGHDDLETDTVILKPL